MQDIFDANIKYLSLSSLNKNAIERILSFNQNQNSKYQLKETDDKYFSLLYENKSITSLYSSKKEASRLIDNNIKDNKNTLAIFLAGSSFSHIKYFIENYNYKKIIVIEKSIELIHLILTNYELPFLSKIILLLDENIGNISTFLDNMIEDIEVSFVKIIPHLRASSIEKDYYINATNNINKILKKKIMSSATYYYHAPIWSKNILYNASHNQGYSIKSFVNKNKNISILIVGAGPSIDKEINNIKKLSQSFFTIVISNALSTMIKNNIKVDAVISTDGGFYSSYHLMALEYSKEKNIKIITTYTSYPYPIAKLDKKNIFYFSHNESFEKDICKDSYYIPMEGSVIIMAYKIASLLQPKNIIIAGCDFSFTDDKTHSLYSMSYATDYTLQNKLSSLYNLNENRQGSDKMYLHDNNNNIKKTSFTLYEYYNHFKAIINKSNIKTYSLTENSAKIENVGIYKMKEHYKKLEYNIDMISESFDIKILKENINNYFSIIESEDIEQSIEHRYSNFIAPWHTKRALENKENMNEFFSFIKKWQKEISIFF